MRGLLERLRTQLTPLDFGGRRIGGGCFVLGSAPSAVWPDPRFADWVLLTVNAAQAAEPPTPRIPDITLMSGQMLGDDPVNREAKRVLRGLSTSELWLIERGITKDAAIEVLRSLSYKYGSLGVISRRQRSRITYRQLGVDAASGVGEEKISTGVFAALLALEQGASKVILSGISLTADGHAYNDLGHVRHHVNSDQRALAVAIGRGLPLFTLCPVFSKASGVPLWAWP
jgi:hypothetical protein